jgi:hypothetical protein
MEIPALTMSLAWRLSCPERREGNTRCKEKEVNRCGLPMDYSTRMKGVQPICNIEKSFNDRVPALHVREPTHRPLQVGVNRPFVCITHDQNHLLLFTGVDIRVLVAVFKAWYS